MDYFAHRIHKANLVNGVVTLHLSVVKPDEEGNYNPDAAPRPDECVFTVNIPLQGFVRSMGVMRELMKELHEQGILKSAPEGEGAAREGGQQRPMGGGRGPGGPGGRGPGGPGGRGPGGPGGGRGPGGPGGPDGRPRMRDLTKEDGSNEPLV